MLENNYYNSIDEMPIYNWFKCIEIDKSYVLIDRKKDTKETLEHIEQFEILYGQFIDTFGINEGLKDIITIQNEILCLKIDLAITNDKSIENFIEIAEIELNDLLKDNTKGSNNKTVIMVEKWLGFPIDEYKVSVKKFYDYLEAIKQDGRG